jgi:hypothetical protein
MFGQRHPRPEARKAAARRRRAAGPGELDLGLEGAYRVLGFADAADGDEVFAQLVLARIIEPISTGCAISVPSPACFGR